MDLLKACTAGLSEEPYVPAQKLKRFLIFYLSRPKFKLTFCVTNYIRSDDSFLFNNDESSNIQFNSIQFFIIYVPSQQLQGQLQTQHSVDISIYIRDKQNIKSKNN
jgi:hypothetical protein